MAPLSTRKVVWLTAMGYIETRNLVVYKRIGYDKDKK